MVAATSHMPMARAGSSEASTERARAIRDSPSTISMMMVGVPRSSPFASNHSGAGIGIVPAAASEVRSCHSLPRSVSMMAWCGGGSARVMNPRRPSASSTHTRAMDRL